MPQNEPRPNACASAPRPARRALVVDDNVDNAESLALLMRLHGDDVRTAHNGLEALEIGDCFRPEIVLLDIGMPRMNGYEVARRVRERAEAPIVLVALTGWGQASDRERASHAGFDHHLVKPVAPEELLALLGGREAKR